MQFNNGLAETILPLPAVTYYELSNIVNRWYATRDFDGHSGGVYVYSFAVNYACMVALTFDRKAVSVPKLVYVLGNVLQIKHFGA
jgi:hypothetical protein